ncbi:MAG TPA: M15 family metallopeptidase, partial [Acidimicrobiales bacterium]|nr:M15 family metallopeptidase [Acidimicrobiales bacterium]
AVEWFMRPVNDDPMVVLSAESLGDATRRSAFLDLWASHQDDVLKELRSRSEDMALRRQAAQRAAERADRQRVEIATRIDELERAVAQQQQFASALEQRLDAKLAEAASLAALDPELAQQIAAEQAGVAGQLQGARLEIASAPHLPAALSLARGGNSIFSIISVRGIRVHTQLAAQLEALLAAAETDGIQLSGAGYRDPSAQVALRRAHCGSSDIAVYDLPPSQCSPPTARPGASLHERGLAVDFTYNDELITSRSSPGFQWLAANAPRFGFYNLPSEPWHWSTSGT